MPNGIARPALAAAVVVWLLFVISGYTFGLVGRPGEWVGCTGLLQPSCGPCWNTAGCCRHLLFGGGPASSGRVSRLTVGKDGDVARGGVQDPGVAALRTSDGDGESARPFARDRGEFNQEVLIGVAVGAPGAFPAWLVHVPRDVTA